MTRYLNPFFDLVDDTPDCQDEDYLIRMQELYQQELRRRELRLLEMQSEPKPRAAPATAYWSAIPGLSTHMTEIDLPETEPEAKKRLVH